ncbi:Isy1-like splicing factor [Erysiphe pulchra]|uniref:Isy1-like splicing factor n=1 Tax=Erysiphe pulchra TaxID=225359 RepID=A0A2S4PN04_9PEZI|nr:Isy1-like splicing factor [Erysiphe pulchra]
MARNSEKAQSMLFRFRESQAADLGIIDVGRTRRPKMITEVTAIPACEKWRGQVLKEISRKVSKIQEISLSEFMIRDLNDEINKLMREKHMWEVQIRNLGGPNYMRGGGSGKGYRLDPDICIFDISSLLYFRYFGRARELPGVKEMFEAAANSLKPEKPLEARSDFRNKVDASYFGYNRDEEDGTLLKYERLKEEEAFKNVLASTDGEPPKGWEPLPGDTGDGEDWRLPTNEEVQEELVERRRRKLLENLG